MCEYVYYAISIWVGVLPSPQAEMYFHLRLVLFHCFDRKLKKWCNSEEKCYRLSRILHYWLDSDQGIVQRDDLQRWSKLERKHVSTVHIAHACHCMGALTYEYAVKSTLCIYTHLEYNNKQRTNWITPPSVSICTTVDLCFYLLHPSTNTEHSFNGAGYYYYSYRMMSPFILCKTTTIQHYTLSYHPVSLPSRNHSTTTFHGIDRNIH